MAGHDMEKAFHGKREQGRERKLAEGIELTKVQYIHSWDVWRNLFELTL
jgi:hypothetical protein